MSVESEYVSCKIDNIFKKLNDDDALLILRLSSASNDLMSNFAAMKHFPKNENEYFLFNCISIVREIANLMKGAPWQSVELMFSEDTHSSFKALKECLCPFDEKSLTKSVLKPIRDVHFHYSFPNLNKDVNLSNMVEKIKALDKLNVGKSCENKGVLSFRYTFADEFKNEYISSHLSSDLVHRISSISVEIVAFLDSLQFDILTCTANSLKKL